MHRHKIFGKTGGIMKSKWMISAIAAGLLLLSGCGQSNSPNQATPTDANNSNGTMAGQNQMANKQAATPAPEPPKPLTVPAGKTIAVILTTPLSSYRNQPGDKFEASVAGPVMVDGEIAIPKGSAVTGTVVASKKQGKFKGEANLALKITQIRVNDKPYMIESSTYAATEKGKGKRTAVVTGGGAALGALIGGLAGGGKGAAIGAGVGGGGGLAASGATGGQNVNLPAETRLSFTLTEPITIDR
jgi:hypothetical protein